MKIINVEELAIPEIRVVKFAKFADKRGYFCEHFRKSDLEKHQGLQFFKHFTFVQTNESHSRKGVIRGLHFQWNPYMGKLVRTISGHMVDMALDIRHGSPTSGEIILYDMPVDEKSSWGEWIWIPPGFAHGNFFLKDTIIEYFCTGEYNPEGEIVISPFSSDIDWSLVDQNLKREFDNLSNTDLISERDKGSFSISEWQQHKLSKEFDYQKIKKLGF